jgi:hypothetical protein
MGQIDPEAAIRVSRIVPKYPGSNLPLSLTSNSFSWIVLKLAKAGSRLRIRTVIIFLA